VLAISLAFGGNLSCRIKGGVETASSLLDIACTPLGRIDRRLKNRLRLRTWSSSTRAATSEPPRQIPSARVPRSSGRTWRSKA